MKHKVANVRLSKTQDEIVRLLVRNGVFGDSRTAVIRELLRRAIDELVVTEYVQKMNRFRESLKG